MAYEVSEIITRLENEGWVAHDKVGSHVVYSKPASKTRVVIPLGRERLCAETYKCIIDIIEFG